MRIWASSLYTSSLTSAGGRSLMYKSAREYYKSFPPQRRIASLKLDASDQQAPSMRVVGLGTGSNLASSCKKTKKALPEPGAGRAFWLRVVLHRIDRRRGHNRERR